MRLVHVVAVGERALDKRVSSPIPAAAYSIQYVDVFAEASAPDQPIGKSSQQKSIHQTRRLPRIVVQRVSETIPPQVPRIGSRTFTAVWASTAVHGSL